MDGLARVIASSSAEKTDCDEPRECRPINPLLNFQGGPHGLVRKSNDGGEVHHAPSWDAIEGSGIELSQLGFGYGPAICMTRADHMLTASHGTRGNRGRDYRTDQRNQIINLGAEGFRMAQQLDITDIRSIAQGRGNPDKYNLGITQMRLYTSIIIDRFPQLFRS